MKSGSRLCHCSLCGSKIECELRMSEMGCEKGEAPRGNSDEGVGQKLKG